MKLTLVPERPADGLYELHVYSSNVFKATILCQKAILLLGRDPSTDYTDPHGSVSRLHSALMCVASCRTAGGKGLKGGGSPPQVTFFLPAAELATGTGCGAHAPFGAHPG